MTKEKIQIIILAAGKGTRMKSDIPKALTPLKGKTFLEHIFDTIKKLDSEIKPIIVVGYKKELIKEALGKDYTYAEQNKQLGTGHAVLSAKNATDPSYEVVLILSADQPLVSKETLERIIKKHLEKTPTITIGTVLASDFEDWRIGLNHFGRIIRGSDGLVKKIVEFKDANDDEKKIKELNIALYAFEAKWLWNNLDKLKNDNAQKEYLLTDMIKIACEQNKKIEAVPVANIIEAFQPNSKEELENLEKIML